MSLAPSSNPQQSNQAMPTLAPCQSLPYSTACAYLKQSTVSLSEHLKQLIRLSVNSIEPHRTVNHFFYSNVNVLRLF